MNWSIGPAKPVSRVSAPSQSLTTRTRSARRMAHAPSRSASGATLARAVLP